MYSDGAALYRPLPPSTVACFFGRLYQGPVASVFWLDDALESALRLDGIVTLVDAKNIQRQLQRVSDEDRGGGEADVAQPGERPRNEAAMQIAYADRVLINKVCACIGCCRLRVAVTFELLVSPLNAEWRSGTLCDQSRGHEPHGTNRSMSARNYMTHEGRGYSTMVLQLAGLCRMLRTHESRAFRRMKAHLSESNPF